MGEARRGWSLFAWPSLAGGGWGETVERLVTSPLIIIPHRVPKAYILTCRVFAALYIYVYIYDSWEGIRPPRPLPLSGLDASKYGYVFWMLYPEYGYIFWILVIWVPMLQMDRSEY